MIAAISSVTQPLVHVTDLLVPVTQPSVLVTQPVASEVQSSVPVTQSSAHVTQPVVSEVQSSIPVTQSSAHVTQPVVSVTQSSVPVTQSTTHVTKSSVPAMHSSVPATRSSSVTQSPDPVTQAPISVAYPFSFGFQLFSTASQSSNLGVQAAASVVNLSTSVTLTPPLVTPSRSSVLTYPPLVLSPSIYPTPSSSSRFLSSLYTATTRRYPVNVTSQDTTHVSPTTHSQPVSIWIINLGLSTLKASMETLHFTLYLSHHKPVLFM